MEKFSYDNSIRFGNKMLPFWEFSNMSYNYSIDLFNIHFKTAEHLFFTLLFSGNSTIQNEVINYKPSITFLKRKFRNGNEYKPFHFEHWDEVRFDVMKYIVQLKYMQNKGFRELLDSTKGKIIIEDTTYQSSSHNNVQIWGAVDEEKKIRLNQLKKDKAPKEEIEQLIRAKGNSLIGQNLLGKILMNLRDNQKIDYSFKYKLFLLENEIY